MTANKLLLAIPLFISAVAFAQKNNNTIGDLSPIFDISPDNKNIVLSVGNGPFSNLYIYSLDQNKLSQLTNDKVYYSRPVYSPKGDKIIFLSKGIEAETSDLYSLDLNSNKITKLTDGKTYVTEASFLPNGNEIIYCAAGAITNYSPMARKAPHDLDLYALSLDGSTPRKLTNFSAYAFSNITPDQNGDTLLCKLTIKGVEGIYLLSLIDTSKIVIEAVNNPRPEIGESFYASPAYSKDNKQISFMAPYQLYLMKLADRKCEEIWSTLGKDDLVMPIFSKFYSTDQKIIFSALPIIDRKYTRNAQLFSYDLSTKKTTQLSIPTSN